MRFIKGFSPEVSTRYWWIETYEKVLKNGQTATRLRYVRRTRTHSAKPLHDGYDQDRINRAEAKRERRRNSRRSWNTRNPS